MTTTGTIQITDTSATCFGCGQHITVVREPGALGVPAAYYSECGGEGEGGCNAWIAGDPRIQAGHDAACLMVEARDMFAFLLASWDYRSVLHDVPSNVTRQISETIVVRDRELFDMISAVVGQWQDTMRGTTSCTCRVLPEYVVQPFGECPVHGSEVAASYAMFFVETPCANCGADLVEEHTDEERATCQREHNAHLSD